MKNWYIVQSHSSFENKVASLIKEEADKAKISEKFEEIVVPTHDVTEVKRGKRIQRKKKYFPGYVLIKSEMDNNIYHMIKKERHFPSDSKLMYKSASGCMEYLNIFEVSNINSTLKNLREKNFWVYGFDAMGEKDFTDIKWEGNNILLFGSEGFGMRQHTGKYADFFVKINMNKEIESLNISNSAAIVFHHLSYIKKKS